MTRSNYNGRAINALFITNAIAQIVLKELSAMPRQDETLIENFEQKIVRKHEEVSRREIVSVFKRLEEYGAGEFIPGRRGHPSRFRWEVDSLNIGEESTNPTPAAPAVTAANHITESPKTLLISHHYQLRPDLLISLNLPTDITTTEASRLGQFINSLPFQKDAIA